MVGQARSTQRLPAPIPGDEELALRAFLRDFSAAPSPLGLEDGRPGRPVMPAGGSTTSGSTGFGVQKACVCPIASASGRSEASGWPSVPSARSGPMWCGPSTSSSTRPRREEAQALERHRRVQP